VATPEQFAALRWFKESEFKHPELMDNQFLVFLDNVRQAYGFPIELTSDGRTAIENAAAPNSSPTSLHLIGRAIDTHMPPTSHHLWALVKAVQIVAGGRACELELVFPNDSHVHIGLWPDASGRTSVLLLQTD
jgi:uncharacterized protein YcbK (DUF882 family)